MSFLQTVEKARAFLERNGRVSLRALQREFDLDDGALKSGARAFAPFILEERARLADVLGDAEGTEQALLDAQHAFAEVGATGHAERLERELRS